MKQDSEQLTKHSPIASSQHRIIFVTLQRASEKDVQVLLDIEKSVAGKKTYLADSNEKELKACLKTDIAYLIKIEPSIVGSVFYEIKSPTHAYISGIIIKPEFQGKGFAKQAMLKILEELKSFEVIDLLVHPDNTSARRLYASIGFQTGSAEKNRYGDGEPRIWMTKTVLAR